MSLIQKNAILIKLLFLTQCINGTCPLSPVLEISNGLIRGSFSTSREVGKIYYQFLGIPYAKPPIEDLRFEPPEKPDNWTGIRDTIHFKPECLQFEGIITKRITGLEDCLYLNVFTPNLPESGSEQKLLPVMSFIHGGGFSSGSPKMYTGKYLVDENVVLVTMSYRLASFGFLSTGDNIIRGNMGLKDQVEALKWIKTNIDKFSGDPERVTIFGESSGAAASHLMMLSPLSKGLFNRVISQTGNSLRRYPNTNNFEGQARNLASRVGCPSTPEITTSEIATCLKHVDALRIVETHRDIQDTIQNEYAVFGPIIEPVNDEYAFLTEEPELLLRTGNFHHVPWITGINSADGIIFANSYVKDTNTAKKLDTIDGWISHLPRLLKYDDDNLQKSIVTAKRIRKFYFGEAGLPSNPLYFQNLTNMFTDRIYSYNTYNTVQIQATQSPVYLYYFDYKTMGSVFNVVDAVQPNLKLIPAELQIAGHFINNWVNTNVFGQKPPYYGSAHGDELFLLFSLNILLEARPGSADYEASKSMVKAWTDFAKGKELFYDGILWPQAKLEGNYQNNSPLQYLKITKNPTIISDQDIERTQFWKSLNLTFLGDPL